MASPSRPSPLASRLIWLLAPLAALVVIVWSTLVRIDRVRHVSTIGQDPVVLAPTLTGYEHGVRQLIVPEHINRSFGWIAQTQQMLAEHEWRVRQVTYENAPLGRSVYASSLYRWWLGLLAWVDHSVSGQPLGWCVERAALVADPLLHGLLLVLTTWVVRRRLGRAAATVAGLSIAALFPFAAGFLPGVPEDFTLVLILAPWAVLPLVFTMNRGAELSGDPGSRGTPLPRSCFALAGVIGGVGLWISVPAFVPVLLGVGLGAVLVAWLTSRRRIDSLPLPATSEPGDEKAGRGLGRLSPELWRIWGLAGAATVLITGLIEFFPEHLAHGELRIVHPLYGVAWLGAAEVLFRLTRVVDRWRAKAPPSSQTQTDAPEEGGASARRIPWLVDALFILLGLAALASVPVTMWKTGNLGFLAPDVLSFRLTKQPDGVMAPDLKTWLSGGAGATGVATLLPFGLVLLATVVTWRYRRTNITGERSPRATQIAGELRSPVGEDRHGRFALSAILLALGPVLLLAGYGYFHLRWWQVWGAVLIPLLVAFTAVLWPAEGRGSERRGSETPPYMGAWRRAWSLGLAIVFGFGLWQVIPRGTAAAKNVLTLPEVEGLVERDLAQWLVAHTDAAGGPTVLAPPTLTSALCYYGGLRGLGTMDWENKDGLQVGLRVVLSTSREEALALLRKRGVTHIVIPSWDDFFASYMAPASVQTNELFFTSLDRWSLPSWLRPLAYPLPNVPGFEGNSLRVFEVGEEVSEAVAASRLAEYFIELGQVEQAQQADQLLRRHPADLGAQVARAQLYSAVGDSAGFTPVFEALLQRLASGGDRYLPWERRVSLAIVLARGKRMDLAKTQTERVLKDLNAGRVRALNPIMLYHLLGLAKALQLPLADPAVRATALGLLSPEMRAHVQ